MKYIENFYNKYASQMNPNQSQSSNMHKQSYDFSNSVGNQNVTQQMSYQDTLSRDEDGDNEIREQIKLA